MSEPAILGLGTALPRRAIDQRLAADILGARLTHDAAQARRLRALFRCAGVASRHSVLLPADAPPEATTFYPAAESPDEAGPTTRARMARYAAEAPGLAAAACRRALAAAGLAASAVTHLVTVSCTGFHAPGFDLALFDALPLASTVERTHVGFMGCHGALNGLRVARAFAKSEPAARVLVCAVELCSLHLQYGAVVGRHDGGQAVANALFADGAAAALVGAGDGPRLAAAGSCVVPDSADAMSWAVGDHGFAMTLSPRVPELIETHLRDWIEGWLACHGSGVEAVGSWAVHPGGPRILEAVEQALGLPPGTAAVSRQVLADHGNMSSPTVLFILERLLAAGAPRPVVALGFGPGLTAEAALLR